MTAPFQDAIVLLGDSLTEFAFGPAGAGARLSEAYARKLDVLNRGFSGYNTDWIQPVFAQTFATRAQQAHAPAVRLLAIWLGANDAALPASRQHVPLPRFRANLAALVRAVRDPASERYSAGTRVVLVTPPPVCVRQWAAFKAGLEPPEENDRDAGAARVYAEAVREVAGEEGVPVVDVWSAVWEAAGRSEEGLPALLADGLHLNAKGYEIVYNELIKTIAETYPELRHDRLGTTFPLWRDIASDPSNLKQLTQKRDIFAQV